MVVFDAQNKSMEEIADIGDALREVVSKAHLVNLLVLHCADTNCLDLCVHHWRVDSLNSSKIRLALAALLCGVHPTILARTLRCRWKS